MFDETLLESSPSRTLLLKKSHYFCATAGGVLTSLAWFFVLARVARTSVFDVRGFYPVRATAVQSLLIGTLVALFGLMLCYVYAESRQLALSTACWLALTCLLNLPGFVCFLIYAAAKTGDWKRAAIPVVYIGEVLLVGAMALVPLIYTEALPKEIWREVLRAPLPPPPPPSSLGTQTSRSAPRRVTSEEILREPPSIPQNIAQIHDESLPPAQFPSTSIGVPGAIYDGQSGAVLDHVLQGILGNPPAQPPPPQRLRPNPAQPLRMGGIVIAARIVYQPKPEYPELARMTRVEGAVEFEAVIGKDGTIEQLKVLKGHPLLVKAALEAVRQWRYQPTLLNGEPVEVITEITVNFKLAE
jgi:protein TonB